MTQKSQSSMTGKIILGSGRSGTTWLQDVLAEANNMRPIFEPLKAVTPRVPNYEYAYLAEDDSAEDLLQFLEKVFAGQFRSVWSDYRLLPERVVPSLSHFTSIANLMRYRRFLVRFKNNYFKYNPYIKNQEILLKIIRANLMMGWLRREFDVDMILVLRHPGAVVESQLRLGGESWDPVTRLDYYKQNSRFLAEFGDRYGEFLNANLSPAEMNTLIWIIENQYPLENAKKYKCDVYFYERIIQDSQNQWPKIIGSLNLKNIPEEKSLLAPSQQASSNWKMGSTNFVKTDSWMARLAESDREAMQRLMERLGVTEYSMSSDLPQGHDKSTTE